MAAHQDPIEDRDLLVSCVVFCYNQEKFVESAIRSALAQDYSPLEILISDDASSDHTVDIIRRTVANYRGPHRIVLNFNPRNLGIAEHFNLVTKLCNGRLIVAAASDDISLPHRIRTLHQAWVAGGCRAQSLYSACIVMDRDGNDRRVEVIRAHDRFHDRAHLALHGGWVLGATEAWTKDLFTRFGPLQSALKQEDHALHFRAAMMDGVLHVPEPLVRYRWDVGSWREIRLGAQGRKARRKDLQQQTRYERLNAVQALADLRILGDPRLESLGHRRLQRATVLERYAAGNAWWLPNLWRAWRAGQPLRDLLRTHLETAIPGGCAVVNAIRHAKLRVRARITRAPQKTSQRPDPGLPPAHFSPVPASEPTSPGLPLSPRG
jgi:glycosyltransferase involved in cell wall biosynthesis